mgnify:CR=1 FL=1
MMQPDSALKTKWTLPLLTLLFTCGGCVSPFLPVGIFAGAAIGALADPEGKRRNGRGAEPMDPGYPSWPGMVSKENR